MFKKQRKWLNKYGHVEMHDLPDHLYNKLRYYKIAQPFILVFAFAWVFWTSLFLFVLGVIFMCIFFMLKAFFEPAIDRDLEAYKNEKTGTSAARAKAKYLNLPEGHPDADRFLKEYLAEEAKEKASQQK